MNKSGGEESCYTDYETDGFWSSEKTLLESVKGNGEGTTVTRRKKKKKKKANDPRVGGKKDPVTTGGLWRQWRDFVAEHDDEWRAFWTMGRKCFVQTVRENIVSTNGGEGG